VSCEFEFRFGVIEVSGIMESRSRLLAGRWGDSNAGLTLHYYCSFVHDTKEPKNRGWRKII